MVVDICSKTLKSGRLAKNYFHGAHCFLTCFDILICCTIICTFFIIILNFFDFFIIKQYLCNTRMILNGNSKSICNCLIHCISVNFITKGLISFRNRRSSKTNESSMWKCFLQYFCIWFWNHSFHIFIGIFTKLNFLRMFKLSSVSLVWKTYNILPIIDKSDFVIFPIAEFLNGTNIKTTTLSCTKFLP